MKAFLCIEKFHFFFNLKSELTDYWWISAYHDCDYWELQSGLFTVICYFMYRVIFCCL